MAATNNYGFNYADKNRVRRYLEANMPIQEIAGRMRATPEMVSTYARRLKAPSVPAETPTGASDQFGPLPGSPEWDALTPGEKGGLTKRRNAAD